MRSMSERESLIPVQGTTPARGSGAGADPLAQIYRIQEYIIQRLSRVFPLRLRTIKLKSNTVLDEFNDQPPFTEIDKGIIVPELKKDVEEIAKLAKEQFGAIGVVITVKNGIVVKFVDFVPGVGTARWWMPLTRLVDRAKSEVKGEREKEEKLNTAIASIISKITKINLEDYLYPE